MPVRPFPFPFSVGTDIVSINRIKKIIDTGENPTRTLVHLARRVLTRHERVKFWNRYKTFDLRQHRPTSTIAQFLAGRFAAKEATFKAVLWRKLSFHDVVIRSPAIGGEMASIILYRSDAGEKLLRVEEELLRTTDAFGMADCRSSSTNSAVDPQQEGSTLTSKAIDGLFRSSMTQSRSPRNGTHEESTGSRESGNLTSEDFDADAELDGQLAKISISHDGAYATAVCLAAEEPSLGDVGGEAAARGL